MEFLLYAYIVPLGAFVVVVCLMAIQSMRRVPENKTENNRDPRLHELDDLNRIYALEVKHTHSDRHPSN